MGNNAIIVSENIMYRCFDFVLCVYHLTAALNFLFHLILNSQWDAPNKLTYFFRVAKALVMKPYPFIFYKTIQNQFCFDFHKFGLYFWNTDNRTNTFCMRKKSDTDDMWHKDEGFEEALQ